MFYGSLRGTAFAQLSFLVAMGAADAKDLCPAMTGQMQNFDSFYAAKADCPDFELFRRVSPRG